MEEIWRDIVGYEGLYRISNFGQVISLKLNKVLKPQISNSGYYRIGISCQNKRSLFYIHRLVGLHFLDNPLSLPQINHIDCNKLNNDASNLEWVSCGQNIRHSIKNNLIRRRIGEDNLLSKLTKLEVIEIKNMLNGKKLNLVEIGVKFNVNYRTISAIKNGITWKNV